MKATLNVIPPVPAEPKKTVTLELSYEEAQNLMRVGNYGYTVTRAITDLSDQAGYGPVKESQVTDLFYVIGNAGVVISNR